MKRRFYTLPEAAAELGSDVDALLEAAEHGAATLVLRSHSNYMVRFCPPGFSGCYHDLPWNVVDCLPVPSEAIGELLATGKSRFARFRWPGVDDTWLQVHHRSAPSGYDETTIQVCREDLCMTGAEIERVTARRDQEPFDFVGGPGRTWENYLALEYRDRRESLQSVGDKVPSSDELEDSADESAPNDGSGDLQDLGPALRPRVDAIRAAVYALGYDPLSIPTGGKALVMERLLKWPSLFTVSTFEKAWKVASKRGLIRMEEHPVFTSGRRK